MYIRLKQFLIEKGLKNKDVALKLGMSESNFSRKINNKKGADFSLIQVRKICKMYKLDPNIYFFSITSCLNDNKNNKKKRWVLQISKKMLVGTRKESDWMEEIVELIKKNYLKKNENIENLTILIDVRKENGITRGILITLPSRNNSFLELIRKV